jgi:membrane protein DedA with SNARE-associated domain
MTAPRPRTWLPLALLAAALLVWAGFFALGAYLQVSTDLPRHDLRKPLIIMGSMAIFLSLWGLALWLRARRTLK